MGRTWKEICADPILADLPFKIESDRWGNVIMSPPPEPAIQTAKAKLSLL